MEIFIGMSSASLALTAGSFARAEIGQQPHKCAAARFVLHTIVRVESPMRVKHSENGSVPGHRVQYKTARSPKQAWEIGNPKTE
jgi:hypothetical protein